MRNSTPYCLLCVVCVCGVNLSAATAKPNFVLLLADDLGYADVSCFGNKRFTTPNIDALAARGLKFTDFHANGAVCSPTRAALMTGRYQQRAGIPTVVYADPTKNRNHGLQATEITLADLLRKDGYATGIFGKWHLGYEKQYNPTHHGFDVFRGYVSGNVDYFSHVDGAGFADWWDGTELADEPGYTTHLITRHAIEFIEANKDRPFFLYVPFEAVHAPYQGPNDKALRRVGEKEQAARGNVETAYREMDQEMDKGIGEIVAALDRLHLAENTLVIFTSDNGGVKNEYNIPLRGTKGTLWEGGHREPAAFVWPGRIKPGQSTAQTALTMDLLPTLCELAGASTPTDRKIDGVSLVPVLMNNRPLPQRTVFWEYARQRAARQGPWKLLLNETQPGGKGKKIRGTVPPVELFNLDDDLSETKNLADQHPDRVAAMRQAVEDWEKDVSTGATHQPEK